jgi:hypothetical protein
MNIKQKIEKQFEDLQTEGRRLRKAQDAIAELSMNFDPTSQERVGLHKTSREAFGIRAVQLIEMVCGKLSPHSQRITDLERTRINYEYSPLDHHIGVLEAAKADFKDGMFDDVRRLVRADLLDDFLSQAEELLASGFSEASVSLGGAVLEDTLRKLCDKHSLARPAKTTIDGLNVLLVKAQVYDGLVQKRITQLAHLRNDADHGRSLGTVKPADAEDMLKWTRRFVTDYLN